MKIIVTKFMPPDHPFARASPRPATFHTAPVAVWVADYLCGYASVVFEVAVVVANRRSGFAASATAMSRRSTPGSATNAKSAVKGWRHG
jgi:hypothetical protein